MVKLRVAVRVIPENQYLDYTGFTSAAPLVGERRFPVIIRDPDDHYYIGTLAREVQERYRSLYKHDLGKIKYIKDNEDDCDLDPEQLVYDLLIDEGKAAVDASDQHVTIKFIQEQGRALRAGSVVPDLTPVHYNPRPRPPVPKFPTQSLLGKRAGTYSSHDSPSVGSSEIKRPRLAEIGEVPEAEDLVNSIETDVQNADIAQGDAIFELVPESQPSHGNTHLLPSAQIGRSSHERSHRSRGPRGPRSSSRKSSELNSPVPNVRHASAAAISAGKHRSHLSEQQPTSGPSLTRRFSRQERLEASREPMTPPSDGSINHFSSGNNVISMKSASNGARASSTSSRKFKTFPLAGAEYDIEYTQTPPLSKDKRTLTSPSGASSRPYAQVEGLIGNRSGAPEGPFAQNGNRHRLSRQQTEQAGYESDDSDSSVEAAGDDQTSKEIAEPASSSPAYESGNVPGLLFSNKNGSEGVPGDDEYGDSPSVSAALQVGADFASDKENQAGGEQAPAPSWEEGGFSKLQNGTRPTPQRATVATQSSKIISDHEASIAASINVHDAPELITTPSQTSKRQRRKRKSGVGDLSSLDGSQITQHDALSPPKAAVAPSKTVKRAKNAKNPSFKLQTPKLMTDSSRDTSMLDSSGEQLDNELSQSARKTPSVQSSQSRVNKAKQSRKMAAAEEGRLKGQEIMASEAARESPEAPQKVKRKKTALQEQKSALSVQAPKVAGNTKKTGTKGASDTNESSAKDAINLKALSSPPAGSMGLGFTDSPRKEKGQVPGAPTSELNLGAKKVPATRKKGNKSGVDLSGVDAAFQAPIVNHAEVSDTQGPLNAADREATAKTGPASTDESDPAEPNRASKQLIIPRGMTEEEYASVRARLKANPPPPKSQQAKKGKTAKTQEPDTGEKEKSEMGSSDSSAAKKSASPAVISKNAKEKSAPLIGNPSVGKSKTKTTSITSSRKSLPLGSKPSEEERAASVSSLSHADLLAKAKATIKGHKEFQEKKTPSVGIVEVKSSQLKPIDPAVAPVSVTTNPKLRQLRVELSASKDVSQPGKPQKSNPPKKGIAFLESKADEEESSPSESDSDEEPPRRQTNTTTSAKPDPSTRDPTPSSGESSDEDDDNEL